MTASPLAPDWLSYPDDLNELPRAVWPRTASRHDGELQLGGVGVRTLVRQFGTPVYVIDELEARSRAREYREAFDHAFAAIGTTAHLYYAAKAFLCTEVARWVSDEGLRIDVCSGGELAVALAAGIAPAQLGFHGNNKSVAEIDRAVSAGVGTLVIDSAIEIERIAAAAQRHSRVQNVRLRVNSGVHAHTHDYLATAHEDQKFGTTIEDAPALVAAIRAQPGLNFLGLHCHIGSQIFGTRGFAESAERLIALQQLLLQTGPVPELNLGGGFGIAYTRADAPESPSALAEGIAASIKAECDRWGIPVPIVAFEPGRAIIGTAGVALYEVGTIKDVSVITEGQEPAIRRYVSVDGGMSDNARPALYEADYSVSLASRASTEPGALVRIAGKHCESGDILVYADYLPADTEPGDIVAIPASGAYCFSLSSNYNYLTRPPVVAVSNGVARVIVRGETESDLLARDMGIVNAGSPVAASLQSTKETA